MVYTQTKTSGIDRAVIDTLLAGLVDEEEWLTAILGIANPMECASLARFITICMVRRYAASLLYEIDLHTKEPNGAREIYTSHLGMALGLQIEGANYLEDVDDDLYCARYLRAWLLAAQLRHGLRRFFGRRWFTDRRAGAFLADLWREGQRLNAVEVATAAGYAGLQAEPLLAELLDD